MISYLDYDFSVGRDWHRFVWPYVGEYGEGSPHENRFWPAIDDSDWNFNALGNFSQFFQLPNNGRYYDVCYGPIHLFFLDSSSQEPDGNSSASLQANWLQLKLMLSTARWKVVVCADPPFSSDPNTQKSVMQWPFDQWGADLVISGESFDYERFSVNRFPYIVNGLGGFITFTPTSQAVNSVSLYAANFGAGRMMVNKDTLRYEFFALDGTRIDILELTKGKSTMKPCIPSPSVVGTNSQIVHGPWANPNGNTFPADKGSASIYYQDNSQPVQEWNWNIANQNWVPAGAPPSGNIVSGNYGGLAPDFIPQETTAAIDTSTGQVWWYFNGQWN